MPSEVSGQHRAIALTAIVIAVNLAVAVGYLALHGTSGRAVRQTQVPVALPAPSPAAVTTVLQRRSRAVLTHDRNAFLATVDPSGQAFRAGQEVLFDNLAKVPFASWRETLADTRPATAADDGWTARLRLSYRLRGFDRKEIVATQYLTFDRRPRVGWVVSGDGTAHGLRDDPQIWDGGVLTVVHGRHTLVLGEGGPDFGDGEMRAAELRDIARRLDAGVSAVTAVVGDRWARRVVALAPATEQQAETLAGDMRNLGDIAALATAVGDGAAGGGDRVVLTPSAFGRLNELGRRVVLTHELVHVAMGGALDTHTPMWLIEGLADYVGYKGTGVPARSAARELAAIVRSGGLPSSPPDRADFADSAGDRLSAAYEEAWLACRMIAERYGEGTLVRLYRTAQSEPFDTGDPRIEERALRTVLGLGSSEFASRWRAYVRETLN
jgi:hypothetical protein